MLTPAIDAPVESVDPSGQPAARSCLRVSNADRKRQRQNDLAALSTQLSINDTPHAVPSVAKGLSAAEFASVCQRCEDGVTNFSDGRPGIRD